MPVGSTDALKTWPIQTNWGAHHDKWETTDVKKLPGKGTSEHQRWDKGRESGKEYSNPTSRNPSVKSGGKRCGTGKHGGSKSGTAVVATEASEVLRIFRRHWQPLRQLATQPGEVKMNRKVYLSTSLKALVDVEGSAKDALTKTGL